MNAEDQTAPAPRFNFPVAPLPPARRPGFSVQRLAAGSATVTQAFAPEIQAEQRADAQSAQVQRQQDAAAAAADRQQTQVAAAQAKAARQARNNDLLAQSHSTGAKVYRDAYGDLQPVVDADTGAPQFTPSKGEVQYDPDTGRPFQVNRDRSGTRSVVDPDADAKVGPNDADPSDPQLYRQNQHQPWTPIGHVDDLAADDKTPAPIRQAARDFQHTRGRAIADTSRAASNQTLDDVQIEHQRAQQRLAALPAEMDRVNGKRPDQVDPATGVAMPQPSEADADAQTAQETVGGGWGSPARPTEAATAAAARNAARQQRLAALQKEQADLSTQLGKHDAPGPLTQRLASARADHAVWNHTVEGMEAQGKSNTYARIADQRRATLAKEGQPEDGDAILGAILKQQAAFGVKAQEAEENRARLVALNTPATTLGVASDAQTGKADGFTIAPAVTPGTETDDEAAPLTLASGQPQGNPLDAALTPPQPEAATSGTSKLAPPTFTAGQHVKEAGAQFVANVLDSPFTIARAAELGAAGILDVPTYEERESDRQKQIAFLKSQITAAEADPEGEWGTQFSDFGSPNLAPVKNQDAVGDLQASLKRVESTPVEKLSPEEEAVAQNRRDIAGQARDNASDLKAITERIHANVGVNPAMAATNTARIFGALGTIPKALIPYAGPVLLVGDATASGHDAKMAELAPRVARGELTNHEAEQMADGAALVEGLKQIPVLKAYGLSGAAAGKLVTWSLARTQITSPAWRAAAQGAGAFAGNVATSTTVRAGEAALAPGGEHAWDKVLPSWENTLGGDLPFALIHLRGSSGHEKAAAAGIAENTAALNAKAARLAPIVADNAPEHLAVPVVDPAQAPAADAALAASYAQRNPDAPALTPGVIAKARELTPPGSEGVIPDFLHKSDQIIEGLENQLRAIPAGDIPRRLQTQEALAGAYANKQAAVEQSDARLQAAHEIAALPDWQPPQDEHGHPNGYTDPARDRETATALLKLTQGFRPEQLTSAEQARLNPAKGEPALTRDAADASGRKHVILTDAGRERLSQASPAAANFVEGSESDEVRRLSSARPPEPPAATPPATPGPVPGAAPAREESRGEARTPSAADGGEPAPSPKETANPADVQAETAPERPAPTFAPGDTPQQRAEAFLSGEGSAVRFERGEPIPPDLADNPARAETPDGATVFFDAEHHTAEDFTPGASRVRGSEDSRPPAEVDEPAPTVSPRPAPEVSPPATLEEFRALVRDTATAGDTARAQEIIRHATAYRKANGDRLPPLAELQRIGIPGPAEPVTSPSGTGDSSPPRPATPEEFRQVVQEAAQAGDPDLARAIIAHGNAHRQAHGGELPPVDELRRAGQPGEAPEPANAPPGDGLDADALESAYAKLIGGGMPEDEAAHRLGAVDNARDADHAVEQVMAQRDAEEQARQQEESDNQGAADDYVKHDAGATELLDAIEAAGGLPTVGHPREAQFRGELNNVRENARAGGAVNHRGTFTGKLFRKDAPPLDELVRRLRDRGFQLDTASDLFDLLDQRLRGGRPIHGFAEAGTGEEPRAKVPAPELQAHATAEAVRQALAEAPDVPTDRRLVRVANTPDDLPVRVREHPLASRAEAFWDPKTDTIHVLPWNFRDPARARELLRHELFHRGLKKRYGKEYGDILDTAADRASTEELAGVARDYEVPDGWQDNRTARRYLAEELLARRVEAGQWKQGWTERAVTRLRELLRALNPKLEWTDADLAGVLRRSVRAGQLAEHQGDIAEAAEAADASNAPTRFAVRHEEDEQGNRLPVPRGIPNGRNYGGEHPLLRKTNEINTPLRVAQRKAWVNHALKQGHAVPEGQRPVLTMLGGGSGSGKTTVRKSLERAGEIPEGTVRLDSDEFKNFIPEYSTLLHHSDAAASTLAHVESAQLLKEAFKRALEMRSSVVLDGTMFWPGSVHRDIAAARAAGYDVHAVGVAIHPEEAMRRAKKRGEDEGRVVPMKDILDRHAGFLQNFESYAPLVDHWRLFDNNDREPALVSERRGEEAVVHRPDLYDNFTRSQSYDFEGAGRSITAASQRRDGSGLARSAPGGGGRQGPEAGLAPAADGAGEGAVAAGNRGVAGDARADGDRPFAGRPVSGQAAGEAPRFSVAAPKPLEQKPYDWNEDASLPVADAATPTDLQKVHEQAAAGWTYKRGLFGWKVIGADKKTLAISQDKAGAAKALLGQHAWSVVKAPDGQFHAVDDMGVSVAIGADQEAVLKAGVGKLLGELATQKHLDAMPSAPKPSSLPPIQAAPFNLPPPGASTASPPAPGAGRTKRGRELPPGLTAPPDPANLPSDARLEEAERQAAAVPMVEHPHRHAPMAPDGRVSNLAEPQWRQVRTPLFKGFFGDWENDPSNASKVLDGKGEPRVMYRGTKGGKEPTMRPNGRRQIYLSESPEFADGYGRYSWETFVNARRPWDYQNPNHLKALRQSLEADSDFLYGGGVGATDQASPAYHERLQKLRDDGKTHAQSVDSAMRDAARGDWLGIDRYPIWEHLQRMMDRGDHDGVYITEAGARNLIVPDARQVKSATHNEGTFDPSNPDTRFSVRPRAEDGEMEGLIGEPINSRRTAFSPESGTLGIDRSEMPQVAAEHRGALANFLKGRGIDWENADVLPGSLKPTQGDFNPGKVEKARGYAGDTERRILTSSDDHVVDGHHQWMARLQDRPDEPMGVVRLNAPVRDILKQIHEFPSAGMEKSPDIEGESPTGDVRFAAGRRNNPEQGGLFDSPDERLKRELRASRAARARQPEPALALDDEHRPAPGEAPPEFHGAEHVPDPGDLGLRPEENGGQQVLFSARPKATKGAERLEEKTLPWYAPRHEEAAAPIARGPSGDALGSALHDLRGDGRAVVPSGGVKERKAETARQSARLRAWAQGQDRLIDPKILRRVRQGEGGNEHDVFEDSASGRIVKIGSTAVGVDGYGSTPRALKDRNGDYVGVKAATPEEYLQRLALSNEVFGDDVRLHGFTQRDGETVPVISQPFVKGREATPDEIADFMDAKGFRPVGMYDWFRDSDGVSVMDAHEGNFLTDHAGRTVPIDTIVTRPTGKLRELLGPPEENGDGEAAAAAGQQLDESATPIRQALAARIGELRRAGQEPPPELAGWIARLQPNKVEALTPEQAHDTLGELRALNGEMSLGLDLGDDVPARAEATPEEARFSLGSLPRAAREALDARETKDRLAAGKDAGETRAAMIARQARNSVRLDVPDEADRRALPFVIEAGGDKDALAADLAKVKGSSDPKLAAEFAPVLQHALDHFDRLDALKGNHEAIAAKQRVIERRHGIEPRDVENHVTQVLNRPDNEGALEPVLLGSGNGGKGGDNRYFAKGERFPKLADAIAAGHRPQSTDAADLLERRIASGQRVVQQRRLFNEARQLTAADGRPILAAPDPADTAAFRDALTRWQADGSKGAPPQPEPPRVPPGYARVEAAGAPLVVHRQFAGLFKALYGDSAVRGNALGRLVLKYTGLAKHGTLVFDTFHVGRVISKELSYGYTAGYNKGLSLLEYTDKDLGRAVAARDITQRQADFARTMRPQAEELIKAGLNVGRVSDALTAEAVQHVPVIGAFNHWVFGKLSRGAMLQTALVNLERNVSRFPELSREQAVRRTAKEMNEVFGNLGSQGVLQSKTFQDLARSALLAPQWSESQLRAEVRGFGQLARAPLDAFKGRLRVGVVAQGMVSNVVAMLAVNQVLNLLSRGQPTWQNEEDGRKLDAFIPGGKHGFWFNPFEIAAEYAHAAGKYAEHGDGPLDVAGRIASNKLSPLARGLKSLLTGRDYAGRPYLSGTDRVRAAALDAAPFPMPLNSVLEKDPRQPLGLRLNRQPGSLEKQALGMVGLKVSPEQTPRSKMFALAKPYRSAGPGQGATSAGEYTELRRALDNDDLHAAADEIRWLVTKRGKNLEGIGKAMGIGKDGTTKKELFTGSAEGDALMFHGLTPEQRKDYLRAQSDHRTNAAKFQRLSHTLGSELALTGAGAADPTNKAKALAVVALRNKNYGAVQSMIQSGTIKAGDLPELRRHAKAGARTR